MTDQVAGTLPRTPVSPFRPAYFVVAFAALGVMVAAIMLQNHWFLNFVHVMSGALWTGIDLFMGFIIGPVLRMLSPATRRAVIGGLVPRTLVLMPTLSILTTTAGWYLAKQMGYLDLPYPEFWWIIAALAIVTVLTIQGLGYLLPTNIRLYYAFQEDPVDDAKIARMMNMYVGVVGFQGLMQVAIMVVMARFVTGI
jgi:hypothetical protein